MSAGRKRVWKKSAFSETLNKTLSNEHDSEDHGKPKCKKPSISPEAGNTPLITTSNWAEIFEPKSLDELALHQKKLSEIQNWFLDCNTALSAPNRNKNPRNTVAKICLLTGPAGAGKTAAVNVLAKKYQFQLQEWINPLDQEAIRSLGDQSTGDAYIVSHLTNFKSFLFHASRYKSLLDNFNKRLLLVEDFPNALLKDSAAFEEILSEYVDYGRSPLVFIVSDSSTRGLNLSYNLFPDEVKQKYDIVHISFNPIANTLMQKAIKRLNELIQSSEMGIENYEKPSQNVIDSIILSAHGDVRNAMINFHFAALKGAPEVLITESAAQSGKGKTARSKKSTTLTSVGRDESVTMLHSLGRVLNPKYTTENGRFVHSPEEIAETFSCEPKKFVDFLHANALKHFSEIEHFVLAADCISMADNLLQEYRSDSLGTTALNIATRGLMVANKKPVSGWLPVRGPKRIQALANQRAATGTTANVYALDYSSFVRVIDSFKQK